MVDELPEGHVVVHHPVARRLEGLHPLDGKGGVDRADAEVERPLARAAAEGRAQLVEDVRLPHGALAVVQAVAPVGTGKEAPARRHVHVEEPPEAERRHLGALLRTEPLVGALGAHRVEPPAAPARLALPERAVRVLLDDVLAVPRIRDHVAVAERGVAHDLVARRLRVAHAVLQLRLAAEGRLHGEDLREASVVPAHVPADEAELRAVHALPPALVHDLLHAVERDDGPDGRLVARHLVRHRARHRLPRLADAHLGVARRVGEERLVPDARRDRAARAAPQLVGAVAAGDARIVRVVARQERVLHGDVLVDVVHEPIKEGVDAVCALPRLGDEREGVGHPRHDRAERRARRLEAVHRHRHVPALAHAPVRLVEAAERVVREHPVARLARLRRREVGLQGDALRAGRNRGARPDEAGPAVPDLQRARLPHRPAVRRHRLHRHRRRLRGTRPDARPCAENGAGPQPCRNRHAVLPFMVPAHTRGRACSRGSPCRRVRRAKCG